MLLSELKKSLDQALVNKILYIERIASILDVDSSKFDSDKFPNLLQLTEADINKIVIDYPKETVISDALSEENTKIVKQLEKDIISNSSRKLEEFKNTISNCMNVIVSYQRDIDTQLAKIAGTREAKLAFEKMLETMTVPTISDLAKNPFFKIVGSYSTAVCNLITEPVVMTYVVAGNTYSVNFGRFTISIGLNTRNVYVLRESDNLSVYDYYHPYISSSGKICWGNAVEITSKLLVEYKFKEYLEHLKSLLCDYCPTSTPYMDLMSFWKKQQVKLGLEQEKPKEELCDCCDEPIEDCACYTCQSCNNRVREENMCTEDDCMHCDDCGHSEDCPNY